MTYKIKVPPRRNILEPEELLSRGETLLHALSTHRRGIALSLACVVAAAVIGGGVFWKRLQQDRQAQLQLHEVSVTLAGLPETGKARAEIYEMTTQRYQEILANYPNSPSTPFALYQLGNAYFELGQFHRAIESYQDLKQRFPRHESLLPLVHLRLGYTYLQQGKEEDALEAFKQVIQQPDGWNRVQAHFEVARIYEGRGDRDRAVLEYEGLIREFPLSLWTREAQARLNQLGAFGLVSPEPAGSDEPTEDPTDLPPSPEE